MSSIDAFLLGRRHTTPREQLLRRDLPTSTVKHDPFDELAFEVSEIQSPKFRKLVLEDAPVFETTNEDGATVEKPMDTWRPLMRDVHYGLHTDKEPELRDESEIDPSVKLNHKIADKVVHSQEFRDMRRITRGDRLLTEMAEIGFSEGIREASRGALAEQIAAQEERERKRREAQEAQEEAEELAPEGYPGLEPDGNAPGEGGTGEGGGGGDSGTAPGEIDAEGDIEAEGEGEPEGEILTPHESHPDDEDDDEGEPGEAGGHEGELADDDDEDGDPVGDGGTEVELTPEQQEQIEAALKKRDERLREIEESEQNEAPIDRDGQEAVKEALEQGKEAAEAGEHLPRFGAGQGAGEPVYKSPEQALKCAERWTKGRLREIAEMFGQLDPSMRFLRVTRAEGGADEIVDVEFGDNLKRVLPQELALLSDPDTEDIFFDRYASQELLQFATVGEAHAGRGPVVYVVDGSESMNYSGGKRNVFARALALATLHLTRLDKRDYCVVEFSARGQIKTWKFPASEPLDGERVLDMASHFFDGGTSPREGVEAAAEIMDTAPEFKKADIVLVGDGDAPFGTRDEEMRDKLVAKGVRLFGIAVGSELGEQSYLHKYCEQVVKAQDFDLESPNEATAALATHLT